jgi:hypothetical protein
MIEQTRVRLVRHPPGAGPGPGAIEYEYEHEYEYEPGAFSAVVHVRP